MNCEWTNVLAHWFDGNLNDNYKLKWFPSGDVQSRADAFIVENFGNLFDLALTNCLNHWKSKDNPKSSLALIIVLDQFSRHIYRFKNLPLDSPERKQTDALALEAGEFLTRMPDWAADFSVPEQIFAMMPFRHSATRDRLYFVLAELETREGVEATAMNLLQKFRKQTIRRLQHLEDIAKAQLTNDVLERHAFTTDESDIDKQSVFQSTESFLLEFNGNLMRTDCETQPMKSVAISLSGGVDSMVIAKILVLLKKKLNIQEVNAIHIDYANRAESAAEADYVESWCHSLGIVFHKRAINEVTRGITDRVEYERVSRDIRYETYKEILADTACQAVIFGHHLGDVQENVISNVMRGCNPLQLSGMTASGVSNGVTVWRPLLQHPKDDIFEFAHKYGVPYMKDTTPSWSTRGKLRTKLVPLLLDMYGTGCLRNLTMLASESDELRALVDKNIYYPFQQSIRRFPCGLVVNILNFRNQPLCFWKEVLKDMMHSMSMSMIRDKSVAAFVERIQRAPAKFQGWLELRKGFHTMLDVNGDLLVFCDGVMSTRAASGRVASVSSSSGKASLLRHSQAVVSCEFVPAEDDNDHTREDWSVGVQVALPSASEALTQAQLGVWSVTVHHVSTHADATDPRSSLFKRHLASLSESCVSGAEDSTSSDAQCQYSRPRAVLHMSEDCPTAHKALAGSFGYYVMVPTLCEDASCCLMVFNDMEIMSKNTAAGSDNVAAVPVPGLAGLDTRLKIALPILVPVVISKSFSNVGSQRNVHGQNGYTLFRLEYSFIEHC